MPLCLALRLLGCDLLLGRGGAQDRNHLAQRGAQDHLAVSVADLRELGPDLDDGGSAALDDVVLGDLACLDVLVLEDGNDSSSSRLGAVSYVETDVSSRGLITDTFESSSSMEAVYFDTSTEEPVFITVKVGLIGSSLVFVPLADAVVSPKNVRVAVDKKLAKDAPSIETDGQLESAMEPAVFEHYGLVYSQGASGERRLGRR